MLGAVLVNTCLSFDFRFKRLEIIEGFAVGIAWRRVCKNLKELDICRASNPLDESLPLTIAVASSRISWRISE